MYAEIYRHNWLLKATELNNLWFSQLKTKMSLRKIFNNRSLQHSEQTVCKDSHIEVSVCPSFWFLHQINFLFIGWITVESCWKHCSESPIKKLECFRFLCKCSNEAFSYFIVNFYIIADIKRCCQYFFHCF